jgi:type I restriction enzyme R subunit
MSTQPEQLLENNLIKQLVGLDYSYASIHDEEGLRSNLKAQLESFNQTAFSDKEFGAILNHLSKGNVFDKEIKKRLASYKEKRKQKK